MEDNRPTTVVLIAGVAASTNVASTNTKKGM